MKKYRQICTLFAAMILGGCCAVPALPEPEIPFEQIASYTPAKGNIILSMTFEGGAGKLPFSLPEGYSIVPAEGVNGTSALRFARSSNKVGDYIAYPITSLEKGKRYILKFKAKGKVVNVPGSNQKKPIIGGIEYRVNGKPREACCPNRPVPADYEQYVYEFVARGGDYVPNLVFYLWHDWSGEIFFDDVELSSAGIDYSSRLVWPANLTFRNGETDFRIHVNQETPAHCMIHVKMEQNGKIQQLLLKRNELEGRFPCLKPGKGKLSISIIDPREKVILSTNSFAINVLDRDVKAPANAAVIDKYGRMTVNGKPFMPFGVYGLFHTSNLKRISEAGFNCVLVYPSLYMYGDKKTGDRIADIRAALDKFSKYDLKIIFALNQQFPGLNGLTELGGSKGLLNVAERAVLEFKDHPAVLGWYISDEASRHSIPHIQQLRETINAADPWHPTYSITYRTEDMPLYGVTGDVFGVDPYPIKALAEKQQLDAMLPYLRGAQITGLPHWVIPQIFNWAITDPKMKKNPAAFAKTRGPNYKEMRAMPLLCAMMGAKGFIFFAEHSITLSAEMIIPGTTAKVWPDVVKMAKEIKRLEPYILSTAAAPEVKVSGSDRVMAKAFKTEEGKIALFIVALGPDAAKAEITIDLPAGVELKSRFGLTAGSKGKYIFNANGIDSDIMEEKE